MKNKFMEICVNNCAIDLKKNNLYVCGQKMTNNANIIYETSLSKSFCLEEKSRKYVRGMYLRCELKNSIRNTQDNWALPCIKKSF